MLYVVGAIVLAVIGAATYLASQNVLSGSDWLVVASGLTAGTIGVTTAHVTGNQVAAALNTPPPVTAVSAASVGAPAAGPIAEVPI